MGTPGDKRKIGKVVRDDPPSLLDPDEEQQKPPETTTTTTPPPQLLIDLPPAEHHQPSTSTATSTEMGVYRGGVFTRLSSQFESFTAYNINPSMPQTTEKIEQLPFAGTTSLGQATIEDYFVQSKYYPSLTESVQSSLVSGTQKIEKQQTKTFPSLLDEPGPSGLQKINKPTTKTKKGSSSSKKPQQKIFDCPVCQKSFSNAARLAKHQQIHGGGTSPYKCEHCKKSFSSRFKLVRHALIHSDRKPFSCQVCERTFHRKDHLKNHIKVHSPSKKVYTCDKIGCNKEYTSLLSFRKHLALHAAEEGSLECQICFDVFETKEEILHHLKIHAGSRTVKNPSEKKFTCEHCDRKFFTKKDVRRHLVVHTGMRDFLCQFCPQRFGRKDHLVRHIKKSHSKNLPPETQPKIEPIEMVIVKSEYPETSIKIETTSESSVSNPEQFNPLEFNIETFSETDLIFGQPISTEQLQYMPSTSAQPPPPPTTFLTELGEGPSELPEPPNPEDISPQLLEETVLIQDSEIIRLLESSEDKNLPLPGFSQTFQSPPPPP